MQSYQYLAKIYDRFNRDVDSKKWAEYIAGFFAFETNRVLDLGCGTGLITIELKKRGYDIIGMDRSDEMLEQAQENARKDGVRMIFSKQDIIDFEVGNKVDAVTATCDVVNYLSVDAFKAMLGCVYEALMPNGWFLFDISSEHKLINTIGNQTFFEDEENATYVWNNELLENKLVMDLILFIKCDEMYRKYEESHVQYIYRLKDIEEILIDNGFDVKAYDFLTKQKPRSQSERIQFVCKKQ